MPGRYNPESTYSEKHYLVEASYLHEVLPQDLRGRHRELRTHARREILRQAYLYRQKRSYTATAAE